MHVTSQKRFWTFLESAFCYRINTQFNFRQPIWSYHNFVLKLTPSPRLNSAQEAREMCIGDGNLVPRVLSVPGRKRKDPGNGIVVFVATMDTSCCEATSLFQKPWAQPIVAERFLF